MFARILVLLLVSPIVELALLIWLGNQIGFWPTIAIIVITALAGSILLKQQGLAVWSTLKRRLRRGEMPGEQIVDGVIILVTGALLVTPGVLTDVVGFAGLIPVTRAPIRRFIMGKFSKSLTDGTVSFGVFGSGGFDMPDETYRRDSAEWTGEGSVNPRYSDGDEDFLPPPRHSGDV
jgi:UPF0716 protein FxsA